MNIQHLIHEKSILILVFILDKDKDAPSIDSVAGELLNKIEQTVYIDELDKSLKILIYENDLGVSLFIPL